VWLSEKGLYRFLCSTIENPKNEKNGFHSAIMLRLRVGFDRFDRCGYGSA
jgi:hypothetical protein